MAEKEEQTNSEFPSEAEESIQPNPVSESNEIKPSNTVDNSSTANDAPTSKIESTTKPEITPLEKALKRLTGKSFRERNEAIKQLGRIKDPKAKDKLIEIVKNERWNDRLRVAALDALSRGKRDINFRRFLQDLASNMKNPQEIRRSAFTHLSRFRDSKLIPTFSAALKEKYRFIRFWAVRGLIKIDDPKATSALIQALGDEDEEIRKEVMAHLESGNQVSFPALVKAFENPESSKFLRYGALGIIGRTNHNERIQILIKALKDEDPRIVTIALRGLGKAKNIKAISPLIELYTVNNRKRRLIEDALYRIGQEHQQETIKLLVPLLAQDNEDLVKLAKNLLVKYNNSYMILGDLKESDKIEPSLKEKIAELMENM
ncbi:MAG: HEAT repeat domain-containing protein [Candidatus Lokiarchaeota archaeon]|nr:HEAT repeat domain-containing protein [Candidatus Harpocratesius repetitus]